MIQRQDVIVFFRLCRSAVDSSIYGGFQISCSQTDEANNHGPRVSRRRTPRLLRIYLPAGRRNRVVGWRRSAKPVADPPEIIDANRFRIVRSFFARNQRLHEFFECLFIRDFFQL